MNISSHVSRVQMMQTRTAVQPVVQAQAQAQVQAPKAGPSQTMLNYIAKTSKSTADVKALTGGKMVTDLRDRATALGVQKVNQNAGGLMNWFKTTSLYQFFAGKGDGLDGGQTTKAGEAAVDGVGHFSEIAIKGGDDTLKLGAKGKEDVEATTRALLHHQTPDEPPDAVNGADKAASGFGIATSGVALFKAGYDVGAAGHELYEAHKLSKEASQLSRQASQAMQLHVEVGMIGRRDPETLKAFKNEHGLPDPAKIQAKVDEIVAILGPEANANNQLTDAITSKVMGQDHTHLLDTMGGQLHTQALKLMDQSHALKHEASEMWMNAGMEMAKSLGTLTEKSANIGSKILDVTSKSVGQLASAAAATGIASTVVSTVEVAININQAVKASGVKSAMKALRHPTAENLKEAGTAIDKKAAALEKKAAKLGATDPKRKTLEAQASEMRKTANVLKTATPEQIEAAKLKSVKLDAAAKQVEKRQGVGTKVLNAFISALKVGAGIAATVACFAGAAALAATPVGWALGAAAIVGGVALGCYKIHQAYSRHQQNTELADMHQGVKAELTALTKGNPGGGIPSKLAVAEGEVLNLASQVDTLRQKVHDAEHAEPRVEADVTTAKENLAAKQQEHTAAGVEVGLLKSRISELRTLDKDISIMRCRKDPNYAANQVLKNISFKPADEHNLTASDQRKISKRQEAESLVEALGIHVDTFKALAADPDPKKQAEAHKQLVGMLNPN